MQTKQLLIYGEIGEGGVTAADFTNQLNLLDDGLSHITIAINSPGGDIFDGLAIYNAIARISDRVTVRIDGLAASIASVIACAAHRIVIAENALMMIHNPWTIAFGTASELRDTADLMDKTTESILLAYAKKLAHKEPEELLAMLDAETWFSAAEAISIGFADAIAETELVETLNIGKTLLARFKNAPEPLLKATKATKKNDVSHIAKLVAHNGSRLLVACANAGCASACEKILNNVNLMNTPAITDEIEKIHEIQLLCESAGMPHMLNKYLVKNTELDDVRTDLIKRMASQSPEINNKSTFSQNSPSVFDIYAERAKAKITI